jgi:hypothetical protein
VNIIEQHSFSPRVSLLQILRYKPLSLLYLESCLVLRGLRSWSSKTISQRTIEYVFLLSTSAKRGVNSWWGDKQCYQTLGFLEC